MRRTSRRSIPAEAAWAEVSALSPPPAVLLEERPRERGVVQIWDMGDASVWTLPGDPFDAERRESLARDWRHRRYAERGQDYDPWWHRGQVADLEKQIRKVARKLADRGAGLP